MTPALKRMWVCSSCARCFGEGDKAAAVDCCGCSVCGAHDKPAYEDMCRTCEDLSIKAHLSKHVDVAKKELDEAIEKRESYLLQCDDAG